MVLGIVPPRRIGVTANAVLALHAAWRPGFLGLRRNEPATRTLMSFYPAPVRQWIARNGGLTDKMISTFRTRSADALSAGPVMLRIRVVRGTGLH
jgi:hypothetical protein